MKKNNKEYNSFMESLKGMVGDFSKENLYNSILKMMCFETLKEGDDLPTISEFSYELEALEYDILQTLLDLEQDKVIEVSNVSTPFKDTVFTDESEVKDNSRFIDLGSRGLGKTLINTLVFKISDVSKAKEILLRDLMNKFVDSYKNLSKTGISSNIILYRFLLEDLTERAERLGCVLSTNEISRTSRLMKVLGDYSSGFTFKMNKELDKMSNSLLFEEGDSDENGMD